SKVEETGITIFTGFAGSELLLDGDRVAGVRTDDKGVDKQNQPKSNFEPGYELQAKIVILAEGTRGSLTKQLIARFALTRDRNPQTYGQESKELWEVPAGRIAAGDVIHLFGWRILGDSAGLLNSQRLKGIHLAIKSGMLAAETAFEALKKQDFSAATLSDYQKRVESSWIKDELWKVRNYHQGFEHGFWRGMLHAGLHQITAGRGLRDRYPSTPGYQRMKKLAVLSADGGDEAHL